MSKLLYNELEQGWECSECGAIYSSDEVARVFDYQTSDIEEQKSYVNKPTPVSCYCMDCGTYWDMLDEAKQ